MWMEQLAMNVMSDISDALHRLDVARFEMCAVKWNKIEFIVDYRRCLLIERAEKNNTYWLKIKTKILHI